jgi:DNA polymerase
MIVGEAPGYNEDLQGLPFVGKAGNYLDQILAGVAADQKIALAHLAVIHSTKADHEQRLAVLRDLLWQGYYFTNCIACRPPEDRTPIAAELAMCAPRLQEIIYLVDPILIIAAGRTAVEALLHRTIQITHVRGEFFDIELPGKIIDYHGLLMAALHPSYLMRRNDQRDKYGETAKTYQDFLKANRLVDEYMEYHYGIPRPVRPYAE